MDTVQFGGGGSSVKAEAMPFWQIVSHMMPFWASKHDDSFSAIVGLCLPKQVPQALSFDFASRDTLLERLGVERFGLCLQASQGADGWLTVGLPAEEAEKSGFRRIPVTAEDHWAAELAAPRVGDQPISGACNSGCMAMVDSGSSLVLVPPPVMQALNAAMANTPHSTSDCGDVSGLPTLVFELGGEQFELPPEDYMVEDTRWGPFMSSCRPAVAAVNRRTAGGAAVWSLGLPFLRRHYTIFDRAERALHIASAGEPCTVSVDSAPAPAPRQQGGAPPLPPPSATSVALRAPLVSASVVKVSRTRRPVHVDWRAARLPAWATGDAGPLHI
mmetsp:Transcript_57165/g.165636  ORF Transcript_57165/g.165636 Transcript_57165/m.165636 type:complete len:330 (+) Transcript_57165:2-991(+)